MTVQLVDRPCTGGIPGPARARDIAAAVRAAYASYEPYPGLPVADGAAETTEQVLADAEAGARFWEIRDGQRTVATLRMVPHSAWVWEIRRIAVRPEWRSRGLVRELLDHVEADAIAERVRRIELTAVVERQLPARYARLGFHTERRLPASDKPLTEATMIRRPGLDRIAQPEAAPEPGAELVLRWFATSEGTTVVPHGVVADRHARLVGVDSWSDATEADRARVFATFAADGGQALAGGGFRWPAPPTGLIGYRMPRLTAPALLAVWRNWPNGRAWQEPRT
jgi:N-acetylglutamate synthase-like GNAT family acetyltransferase